jgi:hypothetical protein
MILVFSEHITPRHSYTWDLVFREILGADYKVTSDIDEFRNYTGPAISYSGEPIKDEIHIRPHGLLSETGIRAHEISVGKWRGLPVFFETDAGSEIPCDIFAMCFYLVTRYEEYLPFENDKHGRFPAGASLASRYSFIGRPLVNLLLLELKKIINVKFSGIQFNPRGYRFIPTFDIDIAYAHLGKGPLRAAGGFLKLIARGDFRSLAERLQTLAGKMKDPFDNFSLHAEVLQPYDIRPYYFILLGDYGKFDRNISWKNQRFRRLITGLDSFGFAGIHPSYVSHLDTERQQEEINRLSEILQRPVTLSRQHFLRIAFPETYRSLIRNGVTNDYSMGWSTCSGYRAGIASPFYFYDLPDEKRTNLRVHPFIFMDTAMIDHLGYNPGMGEDEATRLITELKAVGGEAAGVWHNYALSETGQYQGWQDVFRKIISFALQD